ncbi:lantibiotic dehydratase [Actinacidiphila rubida]|nr:lantibiotic dehydratase [Actinacidiphila rubida]
MPTYPSDFTDSAQVREWVSQVWSDTSRTEAITLAAPALAQAVDKALDGTAPPARVESTARSLARYLLRMQHRATPFGLFAGPTPVTLGEAAFARWGDQPRAFAGAGAAWLHDITTMLESHPTVLRELTVVADTTWCARGTRISVPYQPGADGPTSTSLRRTRAAEKTLVLAQEPIRVGDLVDKIHADYPDSPVSAVEAMVADLVAHRVLLTELHPPMTTVDALRHVVEHVERLGPDTPLAVQLRQIHRLLQRHDASHTSEQPRLRSRAATMMRALIPGTARPLVVTVRPDAEIVLPEAVAREAEQALQVMARITPYPNGSPAWNDYRTRFLERYSMGTVVPLRELTDPDTGLGVPVGYRGTVLSRTVLATSPRDEHLLSLAQRAALTNRRGVILTEDDIEALCIGEPQQVPAHVELCFTVLALTEHDLTEGRFSLSTVGLSLAAGTTAGRFLSMLAPEELASCSAAYMSLPVLTAGAVRAQVSAPPMKQQTFNVGRAPAVAPEVLAVGEHNPAANLDLDDLGVVADADRLYLVNLSSGRVVEPSVMNAVELSHATHPLVRFLTEVHRSHAAILVPFAWGAAARLPFLPEVRYGRTILSAACWRLRPQDLGDGEAWECTFVNWRVQYGVPRTVYMGSNDQLLRLDLDLAAHRGLLRHDLNRHGTVVLHEAPDDSAFGWIGHAHEVVLPFATDQQPLSAHAQPHKVVATRSDARLPGSSQQVLVKLYGNAARAPELLTAHLPRLLADFETAPASWFVRYADPESHVRLRLRLPNSETFGTAAPKVADWASGLRQEGLMQRLAWDTDHPESGRYGTGAVLDAAEAYFCADSAAALAQLRLAPIDQQPAAAAASFVDIATALLGSRRAAFDWLIHNLPRSDGGAAPRQLRSLAVRFVGPDANSVPPNPTVAEAWEVRRRCLNRYRTALENAGTNPATVLPSLLHMHHNRVAGIDPAAEATCRRIARSAALSWTARPEGGLR